MTYTVSGGALNSTHSLIWKDKMQSYRYTYIYRVAQKK